MGWDSAGPRGIRHPVARVFAPCEASEGGGRMKPGIVIITILVLVLTGMFAAVAWAGSSITTQIIQDASDGTVSGHYTAAQMRAALAFVNSNPAYSQYSDVAGVLQASLASLSTSGSSTGTSGWATGTTGA